MIIDTKTSNISFLEMHLTLKNMGIVNNKFFLVLYDEGLQGINPFDPNLSKDIKARIIAECTRNIWYFLRECVMLPADGGNIRYGLHLGNLALTYMMINNINVIEMLPRQHGKTIGVLCVHLWMYYLKCRNAQILYFNKSFDDSKMNLQRFKNMTELLPQYIVPRNRKDVNNKESIKAIEYNNEIKAIQSATSPKEADKRGRGNTTSQG